MQKPPVKLGSIAIFTAWIALRIVLSSRLITASPSIEESGKASSCTLGLIVPNVTPEAASVTTWIKLFFCWLPCVSSSRCPRAKHLVQETNCCSTLPSSRSMTSITAWMFWLIKRKRSSPTSIGTSKRSMPGLRLLPSTMSRPFTSNLSTPTNLGLEA